MSNETLNPSLEEKSTAVSVDENQEIVKENINPQTETAETEAPEAVQNQDAPEVKEAPETAAESEKAAEENPAKMQGAVISEEEIKNLSSKSLKDIVLLLKKLVEEGDIMEANKYADYIKATFYKVLKEEKIASGFIVPAAFENGMPQNDEKEDAENAPDIENEEMKDDSAAEAEETEEAKEANNDQNKEVEVSVNPFAEIERAFKEVYAQYKKKRAEYFKQLEIEKEENLKIREEIIEELKALSEATEDINKTFPAFRALQARWREVGPVPQADVKNIYDTYQHYVEMFYDVVKINNEFRDLDFRKNLEAKTDLCEKAEALVNEDNIVNAFNKLQKLHEEWKELGPVAKEYREPIWERFRAATSKINKMHQEYFVGLKAKQKENLAAKTILCEKAEAIADKDITESNGWNNSSKELQNLQKEWKTIGYASKKDNQKIYDRFRAACDKFYNRKREYYSAFKEEMVANMDKKIALCEQAEAIQDSTDWKKTTDMFIDLQKQWKEIGPVSRKKSDQVWTRFRAACDTFFDNKEKNYGGVDPKYVENLQAKLALIEEIKACEDTDNRAAKDFLDRWHNIGFVPIKEKESVQESFKEAMHEKFPDFKITGGRYYGGSNKGERRQDNSPAHSERERLIQKFRKLESEIATYENNLGFFASSKKADKLINEINKKIEAAKAELEELEAKIHNLENNME